jgi:hypothetical protein
MSSDLTKFPISLFEQERSKRGAPVPNQRQYLVIDSILTKAYHTVNNLYGGSLYYILYHNSNIFKPEEYEAFVEDYNNGNIDAVKSKLMETLLNLIVHLILINRDVFLGTGFYYIIEDYDVYNMYKFLHNQSVPLLKMIVPVFVYSKLDKRYQPYRFIDMLNAHPIDNSFNEGLEDYLEATTQHNAVILKPIILNHFAFQPGSNRYDFIDLYNVLTHFR